MKSNTLKLSCNLHVIAVFILMFALQLSADEKKFNTSNLPELQTGDLIFRTTQDFDSQIITMLSDFRYSHVGFVASVDPIFIVHATTNDDKNRQNQVILSTIDDFLKDATKFGISRINFLTNTQKNEIAQILLARLGEPFVLLKDSQNSLYCTTLLESAIAKFIEFTPEYQQINMAIFEGHYLFPKAFFEYNGIEVVYESEERDQH